MATDKSKGQGRLFDCGQQTEPVLISACLLGIPAAGMDAGRRNGRSSLRA